MTDQSRCLSRRVVVGFLASAAAWPVVPPMGSLQPNLPTSLQCMLLSLFGNLRGVCKIGVACLNSLPRGESTLQWLTKEVSAVTLGNIETIKSKDEMKLRIVDRVRHDFAQGAIIEVDGWLLSLTEARVYALVSLASSG